MVINMEKQTQHKNNFYDVKKNEHKTEKFKRLAENRVPNAIQKIKLIGNLADPYTYEYTEEEANKIIRAIKSEYEDMVASFKKGLKKNKSSFKL